MLEKSIVAVDLINEYSKYLKKKEKESGKVDLKASLQKTIDDYELLVKNADDEQQK